MYNREFEETVSKVTVANNNLKELTRKQQELESLRLYLNDALNAVQQGLKGIEQNGIDPTEFVREVEKLLPNSADKKNQKITLTIGSESSGYFIFISPQSKRTKDALIGCIAQKFSQYQKQYLELKALPEGVVMCLPAWVTYELDDFTDFLMTFCDEYSLDYLDTIKY